MTKFLLVVCIWVALQISVGGRASPASADLRVGVAGHAFDHLGGIGEQATVAAHSGANILYVTGLGSAGYQGLPAKAELVRQRMRTQTYLKEAKRDGIRLAIGYVCATSIVKLENFDRNWPEALRQE